MGGLRLYEIGHTAITDSVYLYGLEGLTKNAAEDEASQKGWASRCGSSSG